MIDEEPYLDAAIRRLHHTVDNDSARGIAVPDIILHVETYLGQVGKCQSSDESIASVNQQAEAGEARMRAPETVLEKRA